MSNTARELQQKINEGNVEMIDKIIDLLRDLNIRTTKQALTILELQKQVDELKTQK